MGILQPCHSRPEVLPTHWLKRGAYVQLHAQMEQKRRLQDPPEWPGVQAPRILRCTPVGTVREWKEKLVFTFHFPFMNTTSEEYVP